MSKMSRLFLKLQKKGGEEEGKKGYFVVVAGEGDEPRRRFFVSLRFLSHPRFLGLLAMAEEEFGFSQKGALAIPLGSTQLEDILREL